MADGMTHVVAWKQTPDGWEVWLRDRPRIRGRHADLQTAIDSLATVICKVMGDGEPVLNYDPSLPVRESDARYLKDDLVSFCGSGYTDLACVNREALFSRPTCNRCGYPTGPRGEGQIAIESPMSEDVGASSGPWWFFAYPILVSERFISLLTDQERECAEWRECLRKPRSRKRVFEVIPHAFVPIAPPRGIAVTGWKCPLCARVRYSGNHEQTDVLQFVARRELPRKLPPMFAVGDWANYTLVASRMRVSELLAKKESRGLSASPLGVLEDEDVEESPKLKEFLESWKQPNRWR